MTLQDYVSLSQDSINNFFNSFGDILANVIAAVVTLAVGLIVGYILKRILVEILQAINFERAISNWSVYQKLLRSHEGIDITTFFGEVLRWLAIFVFIIPAVQALQIVGPEDVLLTVLGYLPNVILAALFLLVGFVVAWFAHRIIQAVAVLVGNNPAHLVANVVYLAIVVFAGLQALLQLGITVEIVRMIVIAAIAASALAVGLGARDQATDLIKRLVDKSK
jgi:hypothetical protein